MSGYFYSFILLLATATPLLSGTKEAWKLCKEEDGIKVYSREGTSGSSLKELRMVTEVSSTLSAIVHVFSDKSSFPQWVYGCAASRTVKNISSQETYHYQITDMPWPIKDRDIIIYTNVSQDEKSNIVRLTSKGAPDYIRVVSYKADWILTPLENGKVRLEFLMMVDPAASIPDWVVNMAAAEGPVRTVKNLRTVLPKYQQVKLDYLKN